MIKESADLWMLGGDNSRARERLSRLIKSDAMKEALILSGTLYLKEQKWQEALADFTRALQSDNRYLPARGGRGEALYHLGAYDAARSNLTWVVDTPDATAENILYYGLTHVKLGINQVARKYLQKFLDKSPDHPDAPEARKILDSLRIEDGGK